MLLAIANLEGRKKKIAFCVFLFFLSGKKGEREREREKSKQGQNIKYSPFSIEMQIWVLYSSDI